MFGFNINKQITDFLNQRFGEIGQVTDFDFSGGSLRISLALKGEAEIVTIQIQGLCYTTADGKMNLFYEKMESSKPWLNEIFKIVREKNGDSFSFPDNMKLMPLKMLLPKKR